MPARSPELQAFLDTMHTAIRDQGQHLPHALRTADRIFGELAAHPPSRPETAHQPAPDARPPAHSHLKTALTLPPSAPNRVRDHAAALAALAPSLTWYCRAGSETGPEPFASGHANASIIGRNGLEAHDRVWIGASLMAPNIQYPDHQHPPEEVYVVLSPGDWRQTDGAWHTPGIGGIVYNPPHIVHAMRSGAAPLLASWCLWAGTV